MDGRWVSMLTAVKGKVAQESRQTFKNSISKCEHSLPQYAGRQADILETSLAEQGTHDRGPMQKGGIQELEAGTG